MNIDIMMVGKRLKTLRKEKGYTQEMLSELLSSEPYYITHGRQYISRIEHGEDKALLDLPLLEALAGIFDCDIGYLLGEIKEKTYDVKAVHDATNLSEHAITNILSCDYDDKSILNTLLECEELYNNIIPAIYNLYCTKYIDASDEEIHQIIEELDTFICEHDTLTHDNDNSTFPNSVIDTLRALVNSPLPSNSMNYDAAAYKLSISTTNMYNNIVDKLEETYIADLKKLSQCMRNK